MRVHWEHRHGRLMLADGLVVLCAAVAASAAADVPGPKNLAATPLDGAVVLKWEPVGEAVEFYRIWRSDKAGERGEVIRRLKPLSRFNRRPMHGPPVDGNLVNGRTYYYTVQSEARSGGLGGFSKQVAATPVATTRVPVPRIKGTYWQIAPHSPSGYRWDNGDRDNACDFSIWQAADGTWQLVSCIRSTKSPGKTRLFYRWEGKRITDSLWTAKGIFAEADPNAPYCEVRGRMQAPQVFRMNGKYYMIYNSAGAHLMASDDGKTFRRTPNATGKYQLFKCGRDIGLLDNRAVDGRWYAYWVDNKPGMHLTRSTGKDLLGTWEDRGHLYHPGFFESPFVQPYRGRYYLFVPNYVVVSDDPTDFDKPVLTFMEDAKNVSKAAAEILHDPKADKWYISGYGKGIYVAEFEWRAPAVTKDRDGS